MLKIISILSLTVGLCGCQAIAEVAYDYNTDKDASHCNTLMSHTDRQACLARVRDVEKQANDVRARQ